MARVVEYIIFFFVLILLQMFLFNNISISVYVIPLVYIAFIIMLPMETPPLMVLLSGLVLGICLDLVIGTGGINTIATLFTAFIRYGLLNITIGKDEVRDGGVPSPSRLGLGRFLQYCGIMVFLQCLVFFTFETLTWQFYHLTLLRVLCSTVITVFLIYFAQMLLISGRGRRSEYNE